MTRNSRNSRLNDTSAIASRDVGGCNEGLFGTERRYRKDRAVEAAIRDAIVDGSPLPERIRPIGNLAGDSRASTACKELYKK